MGKGLTITIINRSSDNVETSTTGVTCMYDIDNLNDVEIASNEQSDEIKVSAKASGWTCASATSTFQISFDTQDGKNTLGVAGFKEKDNEWKEGDYSDNINVVLNEGDDYIATITLNNSSS